MKNKKRDSKALAALNAVAAKYGEHEWLSPLVQFIPFGVGSAIDSVLGNRSTDIQLGRVREFTSLVADQVRAIGEDKVDKDFLKTEEFYFHSRNMFRRAASERERAKLGHFARLFVYGVTLQRPDSDTMQIVSATLSNLTDADIGVLRVLWKILVKHNTAGECIYPFEEGRIGEAGRYLSRGLMKLYPRTGFVVRQNLINNGLVEVSFIDEGRYSGFVLSRYGVVVAETLLKHDQKDA